MAAARSNGRHCIEKQKANSNNETTIDFDNQKTKSLSGIDKSRKSGVDKAIINLIDFINESEDFFTTSSCSGRLAVISEVGRCNQNAG